MSVSAIHSDGSLNDIINIFWHVLPQSSSPLFRVVEDVTVKEKSLWHFYVYAFFGKSRTQRGVIIFLHNVKFFSWRFLANFQFYVHWILLPSAEAANYFNESLSRSQIDAMEIHPSLHRYIQNEEFWFTQILYEILYFSVDNF